MAVSFTRFSLLKWSPLEKDPTSNESSSTNLATELGFVLREPENLKIPFVKGKKISSSRKVKRKWQTPELRRNVDREFDIVLVPSDGDCFSGSDDSEDSDWSIGWLEPHGPEFLSDSENEDSSFAVLVPCYRPDSKELVEDSQKQFLSAIKNLPNVFGAGEGHISFTACCFNFNGLSICLFPFRVLCVITFLLMVRFHSAARLLIWLQL
ncbi:hypothetical protein SAY87_018453 [Trapa incisa]|uniref:Uncharacterized protein n=1 Tax=Trapa incisa TaxID=236973 RepID=A0AAN7LBW9_9MYRT|nr:hypothetical protein SAY87_018453 [Trapa incisa]